MSTVDLRGRFWTSPTVTFLAVSMQSYTRLIHDLFSNNEQGFAYDPNDLSTMFQDVAGTTPVTAAGQHVGLILDKRQPVLNGQNILSNFLTVDGWVKADPTTSISVVDGTLRISKGDTIQKGVHKPFQCEANKLYRLSVKYKNHTGNNVRFHIRNGTAGGTNPLLFQTIQSFSATDGFMDSLFISTLDTHSIVIDSQNASKSSVDVESVSIVKVSDSINHAYQTTSASRPILRKNAETGANYLEFDGSDDFLRTNSIDFTATDKVSLFAGVRKLSDVSSGTVAELSANTMSNNGSFGLFAPNVGSDITSFLKGSGSRTTLALDGYAPPVSVLATAKFDISGSNKQYLKVNSAVRTSTNSAGTGSFGNYPLYVGRRGGTNYPLKGHLYSLIGIGRLTSDSETIAMEKELAKRTGVTLSV